MTKIVFKKFAKKFKNEDEYLIKKGEIYLEEGNIYCFLGESGSGKTTLLNILMGNDLDYEGEILINGINHKQLIEMDKQSYQQNFVSYIHQNSSCFEKLTILDNLHIPFLFEDEIKYSLSDFNIPYSPNRKVIKLSGGERKRINVMQNIYKKCKLLLIDEPTANLDAVNAENIMEKIKEIKKDKIIIIVTHDKIIANKYSDKIINLENKKFNLSIPKKIKNDELKIKEKKSKLKMGIINKSSRKFVKSQQNENHLVLSSSIVLLTMTGLLFSIVLGVKKYFSDQIKFTDKKSYITMTNNDSLQLKEVDISTAKADFQTNSIYKQFFNVEEVDASIGDIYFTFPNNVLNEPFKFIEGLNDNEIVIGLNEEAIIDFENLTQLETIDDLFDNELCLTLNINETEFSYQIVDYLLEDEDYFAIYSSNILEYLNFHDEEEKYNVFMYLNDIKTNNLSSKLNESTKYSFDQYKNKIFINEYQKPIETYYSINQKYDNFLPILGSNSNFLLEYSNNSFYFNNCKISYENKQLDKRVSFSPYDYCLILGRKPEHNNEIVVSSALIESIGTNELYKYITIDFNNEKIRYKIVGVCEDSSSIAIYQDTSWPIDECLNRFNVEEFLIKSNSYIFIEYSDKIQEKELELKNQYENYTFYSYISSSIKILNDTLTKIVFISFIVLISIAIIASISLVVIFIMEKNSYKQKVKIMLDFGYSINNLNSIYLNIVFHRMLLAFLFSSCFVYSTIFLTNKIITQNAFFSTNILSFSPLILIFILLFDILIFIIAYLITKYKKTSVCF